MKPKFALDLTHEGINLLHRGKGGWTLVGTVGLDDPHLGAHLEELRRTAAGLESGGLTCKIIIPNSQILYTTIEAPGPDDIAREVQIRAGLDGLTPYPVGELVFDWRAEGERARVAVLARETMDEAEHFAVDHKFNPVSFVARPANSEFSGEPFFGKTRAASRILGPNERVEPDASPVPRRPRAMELPSETRVDLAPEPAPVSAPGTWPAGASDFDTPEPSEPKSSDRGFPPVPEAFDAPVPDAVDPYYPAADPDDPFAELDALAAELSGDLSGMRPATNRPAARRAPRPRSGDGAGPKVTPPTLAPFPPTPDEAEPMPMPSRQATARGGSAPKTRAPTVRDPETVAEVSPEGPAAARPAAPTTDAAAPRPARDVRASEPADEDDDLPAVPGVSFSTRRAADGATTTATPTARQPGMPRPAPSGTDSAAKPVSAPPGVSRRDMAPSDRRRADMADALARPLPSPDKAPEPQPRSPGALSAVTGKLKGGLKSIGRRGRDGDEDTSASMAQLMRGDNVDEVRNIPPAPPEPAADAAPAPIPFAPPIEPDDADAYPPDHEPTPEPAPVARKGTVADAMATPEPVAETGGRNGYPIRYTDQGSPRAVGKEPLSEAESLTVFGARGATRTRRSPKYLGVILTLLLLLVMAVIALWSTVFVDSGDTSLFNPEPAADVAPTTGNAATDTPTAEPAPAEPDAAAPVDTAEAAPTTPAPDPPATAEVLSPEAAEARYAATGIWQRAPDSLVEPRSPQLDTGDVAALAPPRLDHAGTALPDVAADTAAEVDRTASLPPPPAGTTFTLDADGLVQATPEGAVTPSGIIVYSGPPPVVPPTRPERPQAALSLTPEASDATPPAAEPPAASVAAAADAAVDDAVTVATATAPDATALADAAPPADAIAPRPPPARPEDLVAAAALPDEAVIDAAVEDVIATAFEGASELAVPTSRVPSPRPANMDSIVDAALASVSDGSTVVAAVAEATTTPAIPTSASVAGQATTANALNLRTINLIGISGTTDARRALVRMANGRYVTVRVGDKLDGGNVTSITGSTLTYQKGSRAYSLEILPLG